MPSQDKRDSLTPDEANRRASVCEMHQERLMVWTLLDPGLSVSELAGLTRDQIDCKTISSVPSQPSSTFQHAPHRSTVGL